MSVFADQGPLAAMMADGRRLHLQHGPIDLIIEAFGRRPEVEKAYRQAVTSFQTVLADLVGELDLLRRPVSPAVMPRGPVGQRMWAAALPHRAGAFITPMAAVAGAVADHVLAAMIAGRALERAYVNNGGDIALYLAEGQAFDIAVCSDPQRGTFASNARICADDGIGGVATSGWRGRSQSLGIADAVTVLARTAANADAAATLVANAVDLPGSPLVGRKSARELSLDSDLGERPVTVEVAALAQPDIDQALDRGLELARSMWEQGSIASAFLFLQGSSRTVIGSGDEKYPPGLEQVAQRRRLEALHA